MKRISYIILIILTPICSYSQTEKQLVPSDLKQLTVITEPATLYKGFFRAGIEMSYGVMDKYFTTDGKRAYFPGSAWGSNTSLNASIQYGITDKFQVLVTIPYVNNLYQGPHFYYLPSADTSVDGSFSLRGKGLSDINAALKYQIIPEGDSKSSLTARVYVTFPTGQKNPTNIKGPNEFDPATGNGNFATELNLTYRKITYPYSYSLYAGYDYSFGGTKLLNATDTKEKSFNDGNIFRTGASFNFHLNEWIALTSDLSFYHKGKDKIENKITEGTLSRWALSYEPHIVFQIKRFRLAEAIVIPLFGKNEIPADPQYILIAQYTF